MEFTSESKEYMSVPIEKLLFSERVVDMVEANGGTFPKCLFNNIQDDGTFNLNQKRLDRIMSGYETGLPPIKVQKALGGFLTVLNGRHRVCATILKGGVKVPVCFVE